MSRTIAAAILFLICALLPGAGFADCTSPAGIAGLSFYNNTYNVPQYCDGANWIAMGPLNAGAGSGDAATPPSRKAR